MLVHRLRRWPNISPPPRVYLGVGIVIAAMAKHHGVVQLLKHCILHIALQI